MEPVRADAEPGLLGAGLVLVVAFLLLTTAVAHQRLDTLDLAARSFAQRVHRPALQGLMERVSWAGGQPGQVAVIVTAVLLLWTRGRRWAVALPLVMVGVGLIQFSAKWTVDRPRPNLNPWGFPSAHVLSLVVLCGFIVHVVGRTVVRRGGQHLAAVVGAGIVGAVAFSRIYLDAHWLSDVLGGLTAGLAYLLLAIWGIDAAPRLRGTFGWAPWTGVPGAPLAPAVVGRPADALMAAGAALATAPATSVLEGP